MHSRTVIFICVDHPCPLSALITPRKRREFGFILEGRTVVVDDVRVRAVGRTPPRHRPTVEAAPPGKEGTPEPVDHASCYWEGLGRVNTPVHKLAGLKAGHRVEGERAVFTGETVDEVWKESRVRVFRSRAYMCAFCARATKNGRWP